jgi:hypothetical protein
LEQQQYVLVVVIHWNRLFQLPILLQELKD